MKAEIKILMVLCSFFSGMAFATIPDPITEKPGQGESPGTGQTDHEKLPDPAGNPGNPGHPDAGIGNLPPLPWFQKSFYPEVLALESAISTLNGFTKLLKSLDPNGKMEFFSGWMWRTVYEMRRHTYKKGPAPIFYQGWDHYVTRGDLLHWNYYWVRPLYFQLLRESAATLGNAPAGANQREYVTKLKRVKRAYHRFVICIHGLNGNDQQAKADTETSEFEQAAGLD